METRDSTCLYCLLLIVIKFGKLWKVTKYDHDCGKDKFCNSLTNCETSDKNYAHALNVTQMNTEIWFVPKS